MQTDFLMYIAQILLFNINVLPHPSQLRCLSRQHIKLYIAILLPDKNIFFTLRGFEQIFAKFQNGFFSALMHLRLI